MFEKTGKELVLPRPNPRVPGLRAVRCARGDIDPPPQASHAANYFLSKKALILGFTACGFSSW